MILKITTMICPQCGCSKIKSEKREALHTNGHWNEYRTFDCGHAIHFSPNFMQCEVTHDCTRNEMYKEVIQNRVVALGKVIKYIDKLKVDETFRKRLLKEMNYISPQYIEVDLKKIYPEEFV